MDVQRMITALRDAGLAAPEGRVEEAVTGSGARVLGLAVTSEAAEDAWRLCLASRDGTGFHPVLSSEPPSALVAAPLRDVGPFDGRAETAPHEIVAELVESTLRDRLAHSSDEEEQEEWRAELDPERLALELSGAYTVEPHWRRESPRWLCLVESRHGYAVPGLLPGYPSVPNWYNGPEGRSMRASDHVAFLHSWHDRFGAELRYLDGGLVQLAVTRPPEDLVSVARVAIEQYAYSSDRRDAEIIGNGQARAGVWSFSWS
ncbi:DUF4253 domain-containing protein [Streptomyces sp. NPDC054975]